MSTPAPFPTRAASAATLVYRRAIAAGLPEHTAKQMEAVAFNAVRAGRSPASVLALRGTRGGAA